MPTPTAAFDYELPDHRIAQNPVTPRDSARLLDTRTMTDRRFAEVDEILRPGDLVVANRTRVRSARLKGRKNPSGGAVEALALRPIDDDVWEFLLRPARRLRTGSRITFQRIEAEILTEPDDGLALVRLKADRPIEEAIAAEGEIPLPPYITNERVDVSRYQTIFAGSPRSAAAPTAGLHFTAEVLEALARRGIEWAEIDLEVGIGTFRPVKSDTVEEHRMHRETFEIDEVATRAVQRCRIRRGRVVAIGTTVVRSLEAAVGPDGLPEPGRRVTDLFINPGFEFKVVDALITNFHLPRSSLIVLVAAFMGDRWRDAYEHALDHEYRFLSFGDAMYCERTP